ncbi:MAG: hypothetical protein IK111_09170 [Lachnospiraceae bacterium]|nr:hypothetical protein [Lachnospiraceae bacterium]
MPNDEKNSRSKTVRALSDDDMKMVIGGIGQGVDDGAVRRNFRYCQNCKKNVLTIMLNNGSELCEECKKPMTTIPLPL